MLKKLRINNYKLIDLLELELAPGLTTLTGETGAGKSILLDGLKLVLGERGSAQIIKDKSKPLIVEAIFETHNDLINSTLSLYELETSGAELHIYRRIDADGKNSIRINGTPANVKILKELSENLIDLCSQHQHQTLFTKANHKVILDSFAGPAMEKLKENFSIARKTYLDIKARYDSLLADTSKLQKEKSFLEFQLNELQEAALEKEEEDTLLASKKRLENMSRLSEESDSALKQLDEADDHLRRASTALAALSRFDETAIPMSEAVHSAIYTLEDTHRDLTAYRSKLDVSPETLTDVNDRLFLINNLKRKYGPEFADIFITQTNLQTELDKISSPDYDLDRIKVKLEESAQTLSDFAAKISKLRRETADTVETLITKELQDLMLPHAIFAIKLEQPTDAEGINLGNRRVKVFVDGVDDVEFLFSANPGIAPAELKNIASGGELSRVMLALKTIFMKIAATPTIIFDEIDTGISGNTAIKIAEKLRDLANTYQIICVTHMANIAAQGQTHLLISKTVSDNQTQIQTSFLSREERVLEIGRLLGGTQSTITLQHARELLAIAASSN